MTMNRSSINTSTDGRRTFLRQLSSVVGTTAAYTLLAGDSLTVALAYPIQKDSASKNGLLFTQENMQMLATISDIILPQTDTPSGSELDCHGFVDHQLLHCHNKQQQVNSVNLLAKINTSCQAQYQQHFNQLPLAQQTRTIENIEGLHGFNQQDKNHFQLIKSLVVFGFFTSEIGATQVLNYQAIPGGFIGSLPVNEKTKTWGSLGFY